MNVKNAFSTVIDKPLQNYNLKMSCVDFTDDMLERMDPAVREILQQTQNNYANAIKNPEFSEAKFFTNDDKNEYDNTTFSHKEDSTSKLENQHVEDDAFCPKEYRYTMESDKERTPSRGRGRRTSISYSSNISRSPPIKSTMEERKFEHKRWVVEIDKFATELKMRSKVPSEMEMMRMSYEDIYDLWQIYDEKYNQNQTQYVLRNAFAIGGIMLGFGIHKVARFFLHDEVMDMQVWADHWFMHVTAERPGRTPPFDVALMILLRRLTWVRDYAAGEGSMIMGYIMFMYKEYKDQKKAKSEILEREKKMEERIRKSVMSEFEENIKNSHWKPSMFPDLPSRVEVENVSDIFPNSPILQDSPILQESPIPQAISQESPNLQNTIQIPIEAISEDNLDEGNLQGIMFDTTSVISDSVTTSSGPSKSIGETEGDSIVSDLAATTTTTNSSNKKKRKGRSKKKKIIDIDLDDDDDEEIRSQSIDHIDHADNVTV